jgi:hypothetical protein
MKVRLRIPRALVVVVIGASAAAACEDEDECIRCLPAPRVGDAGVEDAPPCPVCLPKDGVCGPGCIPEGFA